MMDMRECIEQGFLVRIRPDNALVDKALKEAEYDLGSARDALADEDFKWAIIKAYYAMFHAARAVVFALGYKERRHFAVQIVLENLAKEGKLEGVWLNYFSAAMDNREGADYRYSYSKETAEEQVRNAGEFLARMKKLSGAV